MKRILISWVGGNDLNSAESDHPGPIITTLQAKQFDKLILLYSYPKKDVIPFVDQVKTAFDLPVEALHERLSSPVDFGDIYSAADKHLMQLSQEDHNQVSILLSPGTPAMQAVWILLGKTKYPVLFYQSSIEKGVEQVEIPFDIAAEFIPVLSANTTRQIDYLASGQVPVDAAFDDIHTQNPLMQKLKAQASLIARRDVPVLIYGETGTGKELFATAIHNASARNSKHFVPVNCGAIPPELIDSVLFGHKKGSFTGATQDKDGLFQQADGGTIFLDEFGELPKDAQVRLLRVLQSGEITPVGSAKTESVNVRVVAATNRNLMVEVAEGRFREDLFYRVAVGVLHLPPLRKRTGDIGLLTDSLLKTINSDAANQPGYMQKKISVKGKNILLSHKWPGNVRELFSTLLRASLWAQKEEISEEDIKAAIFEMPENQTGILGRDMNESFDIQDVIGEVARHYIKRAMQEAKDNKTLAAEKLGLASYQTLKSWIEKYQVK